MTRLALGPSEPAPECLLGTADLPRHRLRRSVLAMVLNQPYQVPADARFGIEVLPWTHPVLALNCAFGKLGAIHF